MKAGYADSVPLLAYLEQPQWLLVRGYRHPEGYVVAEPYRSLDCRPPRPVPTGFISCIGVRYYLVPRHRVSIHDPMEALALLTPRERTLVEELAYKLEAAYYGVTGSRAVACATQGSDYDLVLHGVPDDVGEKLMLLRKRGLIRQCKTRQVLSKRAPRHPRDVALDESRIGMSLLDSCYRGLPYTIRVLVRLDQEPCGEPVAPLGYHEGPLTIVEPVDPYRVPARYLVEIDGVGEAILETWRTRYQELAPGRYMARIALRLEKGRLVASPDHGGYLAWP